MVKEIRNVDALWGVVPSGIPAPPFLGPTIPPLSLTTANPKEISSWISTQ
jgi:hypothetical protein